MSSFVLDRLAFILTGIFRDHYREVVALIFIFGKSRPGSWLERVVFGVFLTKFRQIPGQYLKCFLSFG